MKRMLGNGRMARMIFAGMCMALLNLVGGIGEEARAQDLKTNQIVKPTSFEEWLILAKGGDTNAQYLLGRSYSLLSDKPIKGVPRDAEAAHAWFLRAASGGVSEAQYEAGQQFYRKAQFEHDKKRRPELVQASLIWLIRAALQGNVDAWIVLSAGYDPEHYPGDGRRGGLFGTDPIEAYKWIHLALEAEHKLPSGNQAYVTRNRLSGKLTGIQIAQAKERAVRFIEAMEKARKEKAQPK